MTNSPRPRVSHVLIGCFYLFGLLGAAAHARASEPRAQFDSLADPLCTIGQNQLDRFFVAGAAISVIENGTAGPTCTLGVQSIQSGASVTKDTRFQVGSLSKPVAAWVFATLVADGSIAFDDDLRPHLAGYKLPPSPWEDQPLTMRQLLSHTAGLSTPGYPGFPRATPLPSLTEHLRGNANGAARLARVAAPGTDFRYSGGGYTLLQLATENLSGTSFADAALARVFDPLEMRSASYRFGSEQDITMAEPHDHRLRPLQHRHFRAEAAASLTLTASDYSRFLIANLVPQTTLPQPILNALHNPAAADAAIGHGFFRHEKGRYLAHNGSNFGWKAGFLIDTQDNDGIVVLTNSERGGDFVAHMICSWGSLANKSWVDEDCRRRKLARQSGRKQTNNVAYAAAGLAFVFGALVARLRSRRYRLKPSKSWQWLLGAVLGILTLLWFVIFQTSLGVYLSEGFFAPMPTIAFLPNYFSLLFWSVFLCLGSGFALALHGRRDSTQSHPAD